MVQSAGFWLAEASWRRVACRRDVACRGRDWPGGAKVAGGGAAGHPGAPLQSPHRGGLCPVDSPLRPVPRLEASGGAGRGRGRAVLVASGGGRGGGGGDAEPGGERAPIPVSGGVEASLRATREGGAGARVCAAARRAHACRGEGRSGAAARRAATRSVAVVRLRVTAGGGAGVVGVGRVVSPARDRGAAEGGV